MEKEVTIKKVTSTNKKKDGTEIKNKWGKTSYRIGLQVSEYGGEWLNGFLPYEPKWKENDKVKLIITEGEYNGKKQLNFEIPKNNPNIPNMVLITKIDQISTQLRMIIDHLSGKNPLNVTSAGTKVPDFSEVDDGLDQINPEDVPF